MWQIAEIKSRSPFEPLNSINLSPHPHVISRNLQSKFYPETTFFYPIFYKWTPPNPPYPIRIPLTSSAEHAAKTNRPNFMVMAKVLPSQSTPLYIKPEVWALNGTRVCMANVLLFTSYCLEWCLQRGYLFNFMVHKQRGIFIFHLKYERVDLFVCQLLPTVIGNILQSQISFTG